MVVAMFVKNGKVGTSNQCPFDNAELTQIYDYTQYTGSFTEVPADYLPVNFKRANPESVAVLECPTCQKRFIKWGFDNVEFHEAKIIPDDGYVENREGEADVNQPIIRNSGQLQVGNSQPAKDCDCGGECDNHDCNNNKAGVNKTDNRPMWYG